MIISYKINIFTKNNIYYNYMYNIYHIIMRSYFDVTIATIVYIYNKHNTDEEKMNILYD